MTEPDEPTQATPTPEFEAADETRATPGVEPIEGGDGGRPVKSGPKPLVWLISGVVALAVIGGIIWFAVTTNETNRRNAMREAAGAYLTALATADAEMALGSLAEPPANTTLLTSEVLAASAAAAPVTGIEVGELLGTDTAPTVEVSYRLGAQPVETVLTLSGSGRSWKVVDGTVDLTVPERRALTVNGVALTEEVNPVFPGSYTAAANSDKLALTGEPSALVTAPDMDAARIEVGVGLSELGSETVLNALRGRLDECLASTDSRPVDCPFGVSSDDVENVAEVRFALANDPWAGFAPILDPGTLVATGTVPLQIDATATVTREGLTTVATARLDYPERGYTVDLNQDPAVVTWA